MISELSLIATKTKLFGSCFAVVALGVADANVSPGSLEDYTLKGMLMIALVFTIRLLLKEQADHKAELAARDKAHKEELAARDLAAHAERDKREAAMLSAMSAYTTEMKNLTTPMAEQAAYLKGVVSKLIERGLAE